MTNFLKQWKYTSGFVLAVLLFLLISILFPLPKGKSFSKVVYAKDGTLLAAYLNNEDKWRLKVSLSEVSPDMIKAIIEKEDKWFYYHPGFNPVSIVKAFFVNITNSKIRSGASTITMQVARMLEPSQRNYISKLAELFRAIQLELFYSKDEILEIYLSMLPYGGNIEGIKSASYIYFNRPPGKLSLSQAILLSIIPNNPNSLRLDKHPDLAVKSRDKWIKRYLRECVFERRALMDAENEPVSLARFQIPNSAPHFTNYIVSKYKGPELKTTLNVGFQTIAEKLLAGYINRMQVKGISNGAILVIDNRTKSVAAYCGSKDFFDNNNAGQVNGIRAVRSPGSTLKAILYANAFDMGILTPKMKLLDIPTDFGGYEPENFNPVFNGEVTAEYALLNSLNVPAVRLLQKVGLKDFINLLKKCGLEHISTDEKGLGLSLILGGCGVTLEELCRLFSVFANRGQLFKPRYLSNEEYPKTGIRILSEESAFLISDILSKNERPDYSNLELLSTSGSRFAWKTGTSYGKRDAWAIGYNPRFTIGVWIGNFDGKGSPHLSGAEMAVPLLTELFNSIDTKQNKKWFSIPENLAKRQICSETGLIPSENCNSIISDYYIRNISTNKICELDKEVYVYNDESVSYCNECLPDSGYKTKLYKMYPPELLLWRSKIKQSANEPPPHNSECDAKFSGGGPIIISPSPNFDYFIESGSDQQILLSAASTNNVKKHFWYINDEYYTQSSPNEKVFFKPNEGKIKITCIDDFGRYSSIEIKVKEY